MSDLYIGLISGTSVDGVDAAIVEFGDRHCDIIAARTFAYPTDLRQRIDALIESPRCDLAEVGALDVACGRFFADCALALLGQAELSAAEISAIGHHGQTVYHEPAGPEPFTMQIGDANSVAAITAIDTVADLRGLDVACGGQGAPLVPAFHEWLFASQDTPRLITNVGGIANVTALVPGAATRGFDTGPGNTLLDLWIRRHRNSPFDERGAWAAQGKPIPRLLESMLADDYFRTPPPKSTGRELFNAAWLDHHLKAVGPAAAEDVQATLAELTAATIAQAANALDLGTADIVVCGGGAHNAYLLERIAALHAGSVSTTAALGMDPDWIEAAAFAWLARARVLGEPGNVPSVTGARKAVVLGGLYSPDAP